MKKKKALKDEKREGFTTSQVNPSLTDQIENLKIELLEKEKKLEEYI